MPKKDRETIITTINTKSPRYKVFSSSMSKKIFFTKESL